MKSQIAALAQQHFGAEMHSKRLPASFFDTANSVEALAFATKDALFVIDDYAPKTPQNATRFQETADRLFRGLANQSGRSRLRSNLTIRAARPPRALMFGTGEDIPSGESLRARMLTDDARRHQE